MQVALDQSKCIQEASFIGYTHYVNICDSRITDVYWGTLDWIGFCMFVTFTLAVFIGIPYFLYRIHRDCAY